MYNIYRDWIIMGLVDTIPTQDGLEQLNCDSYDEYVEPEESSDAKKIRILASLISSPDIQDVDLEWIVFSNKEIGDIILDRVFGGNPYAEAALQAKTSAYLLSTLAGNPNDELLASIQDKQEKINEIRLKFGLTII